MEITEISGDAMVSVENLNVIFGKKQIVHNVSFSVKKGEIISMFIHIFRQENQTDFKRIEVLVVGFQNKSRVILGH